MLGNICFLLLIVYSQFMFIYSGGCSTSLRRLSFVELGIKYGFLVKEYTVVTEDDYVLKLFHIYGVKKPPVLLMHGFVDSADTFIIRGNASLAFTLAAAGHDVWLGNTRGSRYGRQHVYLDPDRDASFWDFSFHEMGEYDLPAIVDYILENTNSEMLNVIGHSQGNTIFYVLGALKPRYNDKINIMIALSPICFLNSLNNTAALLLRGTPTLNKLLLATGQEEILGDDSFLMKIYQRTCTCTKNYRACSKLIFNLSGGDPDELEAEFFTTVVVYYPSSSSRKNGVHISQTGLRKSFSLYDYGILNLDVYNTSVPPDYDLNKVTMKVALVFGKNDELSKEDDVKKLAKRLPNVAEYIPIAYDKYNHVDAVWARNNDKHLFPQIFHIIEKYSAV